MINWTGINLSKQQIEEYKALEAVIPDEENTIQKHPK